MAHEVCILFAYHKLCDVTRRHLQLIQRHNPHVPVVPITYRFNGTFLNSVDLANHPGRWEIGKDGEAIWRNLDAWIYTWFEEVRSVRAKRYILLEWDCHCTCSVQKFYKKVWDADLACAQIIQQHESWDWWEELPDLGGMHSKGLGIVPLAGVMISEWLLESIRDMEMDEEGSPPLQDVFCELRLGTLAALVTANVMEIPGAKDKFLTAHELLDGPCNGPGIYHQIKH